MIDVKFLKIRCDCEAINFHPVADNKLILNDDENRRCFGCGRVISRDEILSAYSAYMTNLRGLSA